MTNFIKKIGKTTKKLGKITKKLENKAKKLLPGKKPKSLKKKLSVEDPYVNYMSSYFDIAYKDKNLNTKPRDIDTDYDWGIGIEHEMQLFHIAKTKNYSDITNSNIIFDSQESTCYLTHLPSNKKEPKGACCKGIKNMCYYDHPKIKPLMPKNKIIEKKDRIWLKQVPWELSGRKSSGCKPTEVIVGRIPVLMPEIITSQHKNRSIESIVNELLFLEKKFIDLQMKNPHTKKKCQKYGEIRPLPFGSIANARVPLKPTMHNDEYRFSEKTYNDYLGSFHITLTLPTSKNMSNERFIEFHQNFANMFQWIEPLIMAAYFSCDPTEPITHKKKIRGSYRVMATGWGNFAGSDLRVLTKKRGLGRYANLETKWRKGLNFKESKAITECDKIVKVSKAQSDATGILSGNVRTFGFDFTGNCQGHDCPKVSGAPMERPYGIELRIFDHFSSKHLLDLMRIMTYLADNAYETKCKKFVYNNTHFKKTMRDIMEQGWKAIIGPGYIGELRNNLGLDLDTTPKKAYGLLLEVNKLLYNLAVNPLYNNNRANIVSSLLIENKYDSPPKIPQINRFSWQIRFNKMYGNEISNYIKKNIPKNREITVEEFEEIMYVKYNRKMWSNNIIDIIYALEAIPYNILSLREKEGKIVGIKYEPKEKNLKVR